MTKTETKPTIVNTAGAGASSRREKPSDKQKKSMSGVPMFFPVEFAEIGADEKLPEEIQVIPVGEWDHPVFGKIVITERDITEFKENFDAEVRNDIPITEGHEVMDEKPAVGWFTEAFDRGAQGLFARVTWNVVGEDLLRTRQYKFFSPEFFIIYEDPETGETHRNVLVGGALTNKPFFKKALEAVVMSEHGIIKANENSTMTIEEITKKEVAELSDEERRFLVDHKDELDDDAKAKYADVLVDAEGSGDADTGAGEGGDDDTGSGDGSGDGSGSGDGGDDDTGGDGSGSGDGDGTGDGGDGKPATASEPKRDKQGNVVIPASEYKALSGQANMGAKAFRELERRNVQDTVQKFVFNEKTGEGKILPKSTKKVEAFMLGLSEKQREAFTDILGELPKANMFKEIGTNSGSASAKAESEVDKAVKQKMSEDSSLQYSDALRMVFAENPQLAEQHEREVNGQE